MESLAGAAMAKLFPDFEDMSEEEQRSFDPFALPNPYTPSTRPSSTKRIRTSLNYADHSVYTFGVAEIPTKVQLLSDHTLAHLVEALCRHAGIVEGTVDARMWNVAVGGVLYESGTVPILDGARRAGETRLRSLRLDAGAEMLFTWNYNAKQTFTVALESVAEASGDLAAFPREMPLAGVAGYTEYTTEAVDLDELCPAFNEYAFGSECAKELHFGQPGMKCHYGLFVSEGALCADMLYFPEKLETLERYLSAAEQGAQIFPPGTPDSSWRSCCVFDKAGGKYGKFVEATYGDNGWVALAGAQVAFGARLGDVYPRFAALLGMRSDKRVKKGWVSYHNGIMSVCQGPSATPKSAGLNTCAFAAWKQYTPKSDDGVLRRMKVEVASLHQFFGVVEGLLRTLD